MEERIPYVVPPWWKPPEIKICKSKEDAIAEHSREVGANHDTLHVYTDGGAG